MIGQGFGHVAGGLLHQRSNSAFRFSPGPRGLRRRGRHRLVELLPVVAALEDGVLPLGRDQPMRHQASIIELCVVVRTTGY